MDAATIDRMTDDEIAAALFDAPVSGAVFEAAGDDPDSMIVGVPGPIWSIEGGEDAYVVFWVRQHATTVVWDDDGHETDCVHITLPIDQMDALKDAIDRAVADVRSRTEAT